MNENAPIYSPIDANSQQRISKIEDFKTPQPISGLYHNVEPLVVRRDFSSFPHFCNVFVVKKSNPNYPRLTKIMNSLNRNEKLGPSIEFDLLSNVDTKITELNKKCYYFIDIRKEPSSYVNLSLKNFFEVPKMVRSLVCNQILDNVRGLWVFADSVQDIPTVLMSRSQWGLSEEEGLDLHYFVHKGCSKSPYCLPKKTKDNLIGFITTEKEGKIVEF
jgi:hypothetical protein